MTDLSAFTPDVAPAQSQLLSAGSQFTASRFDTNMRAVQEVERSWRSPALPDSVKFDLASMDTDDGGLKDLLLGIDEALNERPEPIQSRLQVPERPQISGLQQLQVIMAANTNNPAPTELSEDAVVEWQREAVRRGILDADTPADGRWRPEYNRLKSEMAWDRQNEAMRGNRPGAVPISGPNGVMKLLDDFTSPAGLLSMATELDLFWDFNAIGEEFRSWGDKWREVGKSKNPLDFAGNLFDALTGPIDDILVPVINDALLISGVGTVFNVGRAAIVGGRTGYAAARLAQSAQSFERIYSMGRIGTWAEKAGLAGRAAANIDEIGQASMTAQRLLRSGSGATQGLGRAMEGWRTFTPVRASKEIVQQGMRLGAMATLQNDYMGSYASDGASINQIPGVETLQSGLEVVKRSPLGMIPEVALAPYNIFSPGTFVKQSADSMSLANRIGSKVFEGLGTIGGRAAAGGAVGVVGGTIAGDDAGDIAKGAVIGAGVGAAAPAVGKALQNTAVAGAARGAVVGGLAGAWLGDDPSDAILGALAGAGTMAVTDTARQAFAHSVGASPWNKAVKGAGRALEATSWKPFIDNNERIGGFFDQGIRRWLADDTEGLSRWSQSFAEKGLYGAIEDTWGLDSESAAGLVGFIYTSSAIDWIATVQAKGLGTGDNFYENYLKFRSKLVSQTRSIKDVEAPTASLIDDMAHTMALSELGAGSPQKVTKRARELSRKMRANPAEALALANAHNERAAETVTQLFNPRNFPAVADDIEEGWGAAPGVADQVTQALGQNWAGLSENTDQLGAIMLGYMPQAMENFGKWDTFTAATSQIRDLRVSGLFDSIQLKKFQTRTGDFKLPRGAKPRAENTEALALARQMDDMALDGAAGAEKVADLKLAPFAPAEDYGRVSVMRIDGVTKQQLEELGEKLADVKKAHELWASMGGRASKLYDKLGVEFAGRLQQKHLDDLLGESGLGAVDNLKDFTDSQIKVIAEQVGKKLGGKKGFEYLLNFARRHELSMADMDSRLTQMADKFVGDTAMWQKFGLASEITDANGLAGRATGMDALSARIKEVNRKARTTAAEIDMDDLVAFQRAKGAEGAAKEAQDLQEWMTENGYKLVHGREFLMPEDVAFGDMMFDVTQRHLNAATLGNFFKGKTPIEQKLATDRRRRLALVDELSKSGLDVGPESDDVSSILADLQEFMRQTHDRTAERLRGSHEQTFGKRFLDRLQSSWAPVDMADAGGNKKALISFLKNERGLSDDQAQAAWRATFKFRSADFQDVGLYALEAKARQMNVAEWGLKTLTGSKYEGIIQRARGPMAAAAAGATIGAVQTLDDPDMSFEDKIKAAAKGAAIGAGAAVAGQALGTAVSEGVGKALTKFDIGAGGSLVDRSANWRYGYLPDMLARARDSMRFTLSPFFDISRYTEGLMLAQTAAPHRGADGKRLAMQLNMSPSGLRRRIAKAEGISKEAARVKYDAYMSDFKRAARGDFDPEAMAEAGQWFKQVGIMGFSPTDWMATAFAQMKINGIDSETAYKSAREMYTYATKGRSARSAAEMSANFLVFPFSFQKKALTHVGKWLNDDLARSIMIHDAFKTYEMLDKEYDLDQYWKDHIPMMRQLQRLNMFAYGISAGRFGGMNSQLFEGAGKVAWNLFVPANLEIKDAAALKEAQDVFKGLAPAISDINWMVDNLKETGNVVFGDSHVTSAAQVRKGYSEWYEFKDQFEAQIKQQGYTFGEVMNSEWTQDIADVYRNKKAELSEKYPAWAQSQIEAVQEHTAEAMARTQRLAQYQLSIDQGRQPSPDNRMLYEMDQLISEIKEEATFFTDADNSDIPMEYVNQIRDLALQFARQNPSFRGLWKTYWEKTFGPLELTLQMQ